MLAALPRFAIRLKRKPDYCRIYELKAKDRV